MEAAHHIPPPHPEVAMVIVPKAIPPLRRSTVVRKPWGLLPLLLPTSDQTG